MGKILSLLVSRYFAIALAGAVFVATNAHAGPSRGLSLASADPSPQSQEPAPAPSAPASAPTTEAPKQAPAPTKAEPSKPKAKHISTEARIVRVLHSHGIYW
jgi:hypothetical protein